MKKVTGLALAALLAGAAFVPALADRPGADWISAEEARSKVKAAGYSSVFSIEPDDGHWECKGIKNGRVHEFHVDPRTGAITKDQPDS